MFTNKYVSKNIYYKHLNKLDVQHYVHEDVF